MAALSATNTATASLQSMLTRSRLEVARREAQQAQAEVLDLRNQVAVAETELNKRRNSVRSLNDQSSQSDPTYKSAIKSLSADTPVKTQEFLYGMYRATSAKNRIEGSKLKVDPNTGPIINTQGQATGRIVNVSA